MELLSGEQQEARLSSLPGHMFLFKAQGSRVSHSDGFPFSNSASLTRFERHLQLNGSPPDTPFYLSVSAEHPAH